MSNNFGFAIPLMLLVYLEQTSVFKPLQKIFKLPLIVLAAIIFLFDLLITLYFYSGCFEISINYGHSNCLNWIYPTLYFKIMVLAFVLILTLSVYALIQQWQKRLFYLLSSLVLVLGVIFRAVIFIQLIQAIVNFSSINKNVIFDFFSIMVIYGLVSAAIFIAVFFMGVFRRFSSVR